MLSKGSITNPIRGAVGALGSYCYDRLFRARFRLSAQGELAGTFSNGYCEFHPNKQEFVCALSGYFLCYAVIFLMK